MAGAVALDKLPPGQAAPVYGALDGFENKVDAAGFDPCSTP